MMQGVSQTCTATCPNKEGQVAIYQWHTYTEAVSKVEMKTCDFVCKHGANIDEPPACPPGACKNDNCSECHPWADDREVREREKSKGEIISGELESEKKKFGEPNAIDGNVEEERKESLAKKVLDLISE